ncbi:MAG: uracil phosphoribosyltransferase [Calditrichaeota bacterium]|nr:MAG: uracil phosphoribosyltransferase [Calditrichota bacterium]
MKNVNIVDHPFLLDRLRILRDKNTTTTQFRNTVIECGEILSFAISQDFPTKSVTVETPLEFTKVFTMNYPVTIVAILRAALGMTEGLTRYFPDARIGHIGIYRNEETLKPVNYYCKMPSDLSAGYIVVADPMIATGGSLIAALDVIATMTTLDSLRIATLIAAPEGINAVSEKYPNIPIYTAAVDRELNELGYIVPGLGDAGDRQYGTF